jgi:aryl-alcohol dehydrogenase-like predicted oxidoreductase
MEYRQLGLGTDAIDLYQLHTWDSLTPVGETLSFLDAAVRGERACRPSTTWPPARPSGR